MHRGALVDAAAPYLPRCSFPAASASPVVCAVSGGADSSALLILAVAAGCDARAVHVDHGLRPGSAAESETVAALADALAVPFEAKRVEVEPGPNLEARARDARYGVLPPDVCTGHTADDQAETILLAMLRGAAFHGLGGMEPGPRRPILGLRRAETTALCAALGVTVVDDPSNADPAHTRNRVRHELLPLLGDIARRDPVPVLVRQAELLRQGAAVVADAAAAIDPTDSRALAAAPELLAREAVRRWLVEGRPGTAPPDLATVDRVLAVARLECRATDVGGGWQVRRTGGRLRLVVG